MIRVSKGCDHPTRGVHYLRLLLCPQYRRLIAGSSKKIPKLLVEKNRKLMTTKVVMK
jgi:hypothetical protein